MLIPSSVVIVASTAATPVTDQGLIPGKGNSFFSTPQLDHPVSYSVDIPHTRSVPEAEQAAATNAEGNPS